MTTHSHSVNKGSGDLTQLASNHIHALWTDLVGHLPPPLDSIIYSYLIHLIYQYLLLFNHIFNHLYTLWSMTDYYHASHPWRATRTSKKAIGCQQQSSRPRIPGFHFARDGRVSHGWFLHLITDIISRSPLICLLYTVCYHYYPIFRIPTLATTAQSNIPHVHSPRTTGHALFIA